MVVREMPYTNLHDLNIDWILRIVKDFQDRYQNLDETFQNMLQQITTAGENAVEAINNNEETALEAIRVFLEQCEQALSAETTADISEIRNVTNSQIDAINATGTNQIGLIIQEADYRENRITNTGTQQVNIINNLITSLPETYEDCVNQLQIINSVLNQTYNYPPLVQGHYADTNESDSKTLVSDNYRVSTLLSAGCASKRIRIQVTNVNGIIRDIIYWTGWGAEAIAHTVSVSTSSSDEKTLYSYTFPATATYFTIVFAYDYNMGTQLLVSDIQVSLQWQFTALESIALYEHGFDVSNTNALEFVIPGNTNLTIEDGSEIDEIDVSGGSKSVATSHKIKDATARESVSELNSAFTHVIENIPQTETLDENSQIWTIADNTYCDSSGLASSNSHKSFYTTVNTRTTLFFTDYVITYTSLCVFTSGVMGGDGYTRYRTINGTGDLPQEGSPIVIPEGSLICVSINKNSGSHFTLKATSNGQYYKPTEYLLLPETNVPKAYHLAYDGTNLSIRGENGVECVFNRNDFNEDPGLFELQNLTYKSDVIFGTVNDYIGPVRVNGEAIKGAKHGGETTDTVKIITDHGTMQSGDAIDTESFSIYVLSHISDEFSRISLWTFNRDSMICDSIITVLKQLNIDYIFGAGIISCQNDVNVAWLNNTQLTQDVLAGLNEHTEIITNHGTLISERMSCNSNYDHRVSFVLYNGRKKLYYYTVYGNNIAVNANTVFASSAKLTFS